MKKTFRLLGSLAALVSAGPVHSNEPPPAAAEPSARATGEALCGPEIVLIGDAWEHVRLERDRVVDLTRRGELDTVPGRLASLSSHLQFMQNRAVMVFGARREALRQTALEVDQALPRWSAWALAGQGPELEAAWPQLQAAVDTFGAQFPGGALISSSEASFLLPPVVPTTRIALLSPPVLEAGRPAKVRFRLTGGDGQPLHPDFLHTTHTEKLHALLLDPLFRDYHHAHPLPEGGPGEYTFTFTFTPAQSGPYRLWLDAMPVATGRTEFPISDLARIPRPIRKAPPPGEPVLTVRTEDFQAVLTLPEDGLAFARDSVLTLTLTEAGGKPVTRLQPWMGAFAHVVGFADDFQTIHHIHPLGPMPDADDRGGPEIRFRVRPSLPGWLRLYVQFSLDGQVRPAAFAVPVTVR